MKAIRKKKQSLISTKNDANDTEPQKKSRKSKVKNSRKINNKPLSSEKTGMNVSPAKVKNIISNYVLNHDIYKAINEVKYLQRNEKPLSEISDETKSLISEISNDITASKRRQYERNKYEGLSQDEKKRYLDEKNTFKSKLDKNDKASYDIQKFNLSFDDKFYDDFSCDLSFSNDYNQLIKAIAKSKFRFSYNSRIYLSSFIELIIRQIAYNSIYTCVKNNRKIIQVEHNLVKHPELSNGEYSLFNMVRNLNVSQEYLEKSDTDEVVLLENLTKEKQNQFKYYISETCREIKQELSSKFPSDNYIYNSTSISKNFKNYGSSVVCEVLIIIGKMIKVEVEFRSVKTVNDSVIKTVLSQLHTANNIDFISTKEFIDLVSKKYSDYIITKKNEKEKTNKDTDK